MAPYGTSAQMAAHAPYEWTYSPTMDDVARSYATAVCRQLAGKPAGHAPDSSLHATTRKFAVMVPSDDQLGGPFPGMSPLLAILDGCGVHAPKVVRYKGEREEGVALAAEFRELQQDGVTSVLYFPWVGDATPQSPPWAASSVSYFPEWVLMGWNNYLTASLLNEPKSEMNGAFGVGMWNQLLPPFEEFWAQAYLAGGGEASAVQSSTYADGRAFYNEMLLLASGIQLAGPHLTPESFARGLTSTAFPNPGAGAAPFHQATVGFGPGDITMTNDYLEFWLDTRTTGAEINQGMNTHYRATCQVDLGRRWTQQTWPTADLFYQGPCR
jgi:hypothetical protein